MYRVNTVCMYCTCLVSTVGCDLWMEKKKELEWERPWSFSTNLFAVAVFFFARHEHVFAVNSFFGVVLNFLAFPLPHLTIEPFLFLISRTSSHPPPRITLFTSPHIWLFMLCCATFNLDQIWQLFSLHILLCRWIMYFFLWI